MPSSSPIPSTSNSSSNYPHHSSTTNNNNNINNVNHNNSNNNSPSNHSYTTLRKPLDPTLLARGMTARSVGSRISSSIKSLSNNEIEKDFRHMEAYGTACIAYAQQFFAFTNRELVARGHFSNGNSGGVGATGIGGGVVPPGVTYSDTNTSLYPNQQNQPPHTDANGHPINVGMGGITMPVRIDPEEEKRLSILRSRVAASEAKREILETEYLSLRAHYVHESHKLHRARSVVSGQMKLLKDLVQKRGEVLGLCRARYGIARDILHSLEYRSNALKRGEDGKGVVVVNDGNNNTTTTTNNEQLLDSNGDVIMSGNENGISTGSGGLPTSVDNGNTNNGNNNNSSMAGNNESKTKDSNSKGTHSNIGDMSAIWDIVESRLQEAEQACMSNVETPQELLQMKAALAADAAALEAATEGSSFANGSIVQRNVKSPTRGANNDEEEDTTNAGSKKKNGRRGDEILSSDGMDGNGKRLSKGDGDNNTIPWTCPVYPRTPYDVAILLSNLSTAPDRAAAFACGDSNGRPSKSLSWLEPNLPPSQNGEMNDEAEKLERVRNEVMELSKELANEVQTNSDLQKEIIKGRKRRDQLCSMMSMIRSETEAVIERYNEVLQTPEAMSEVDSLNQNKTDMDEQMNYIEEYDDEEGELEDGENSEDGTVVPGDGDDEGDDTVDDQFNQFNNDVYDDFNSGGQPMKEITVRLESNETETPIVKNGPVLNNNKRGYDVSSTVDPTDESDNKRRKI